jgi:hypothetical protein
MFASAPFVTERTLRAGPINYDRTLDLPLAQIIQTATQTLEHHPWSASTAV